MFPIAVLIAAAGAHAVLRQRLSAEALELLTFSDTEVLKALEVISAKHPSVVVLERGFSTTARGVALIRRIKADPSLEATVIQIESIEEPLPTTAAAQDEAMSAVVTAHTHKTSALDTGTRRAPRFVPDETLEVQVDGARATLLDVSAVGAKLLTSNAVRPSQRVRVSLQDKSETIRFSASVVWASFEIPKDSGPRYRVGVDFVNPDTAKLESFIARHTRA